MKVIVSEIENISEIQLHLMTTALYYGEFSTIQAMCQKSSRVALALGNKDITAIRNFAKKLVPDISLWEADRQQVYEELYQKVKQAYEEIITATPVPLAESYLREVADSALEKKKFLSAHNAYAAVNRLDKKVNELMNRGIQLLNSKEVALFDKGSSENVSQILKQAAYEFYTAIRLRMPFGLEFQYRGVEFFTTAQEGHRKYDRYVEQGESVLKEIIHFGFQYLVNNKTIAEKIISNTKNNKIKKLLLKHLTILFAGGIEQHQKFAEQYLTAVKKLKDAKTEFDYMNIQRILLGRNAGTDTTIQYLKELSSRFPISPLLIKIEHSPAGVTYLAPLMLKNTSLLEILDLDK